MWLFDFYRLYVSISAGILSFFFLIRSIPLCLGISASTRILWWFVEWLVQRIKIQRQFSKFGNEFKVHYGPYGIRIVNKAQSDFRIKTSLCEVFVESPDKLKKAVEQLEVMDTLFKAGMQPQGDDYLLHDLKLKFGKLRLEKITTR